jgi:excisionase family DNA binding protein
MAAATAESRTFLTKEQLARELQVSPRTIERRVADGTLPQPISFGRVVRWPSSDVRHLERRTRRAN